MWSRTFALGTTLLLAHGLIAVTTEIPLPPDFIPRKMKMAFDDENLVTIKAFQIAAGGDKVLYAVCPASYDDSSTIRFHWMMLDLQSRKTGPLIGLVPGLKKDGEMLLTIPKTRYVLCDGDHGTQGTGLLRIDLGDRKAKRVDCRGSFFCRAGSSVAFTTYEDHAWGAVKLMDLDSGSVRELPIHGLVSGASEDGRILFASANPNDPSDGSQKSWRPLLLTNTGRVQADLSRSSLLNRPPPQFRALLQPVVSPTGKWVAGTITWEPYTVPVIGPDLKGYAVERSSDDGIGMSKVIGVLDDGSLLVILKQGEDKTGGDLVVFRRNGKRETICPMPAAAEVWGGNLYMLFLGDKPVLRILPIQGLKGTPRN